MRNNLGEKRIPTLIGLLIIAIGIFGTTFLVQNLRPFWTGATPSEIPQEIKIINLSPDSLVISWTTQSKVSGSVRFWKGSLTSKEENQKLTAIDDKDKPGAIGAYDTHSVSLKSLTPNTTYYFVINSGRDSYDNNGIPYQASTGDYHSTNQSQIPEEATPSGKNFSKLLVSPPAGSITLPKISSPKEGEGFTDPKPRFSGTALKGATIKITIQSPTPTEVTVKADSSGRWSYRPETPLSPGEHTLTIVAPDSNGILRTISQNFKVFAAGTQVEEPATPSATPTIASPTPTKVITPTPLPTEIPIPTKAPKPIPPTGESLPLVVLSAFGIITFLAGLALLF